MNISTLTRVRLTPFYATWANIHDPDHTPQCAASDQGIHVPDIILKFELEQSDTKKGPRSENGIFVWRSSCLSFIRQNLYSHTNNSLMKALHI